MTGPECEEGRRLERHTIYFILPVHNSYSIPILYVFGLLVDQFDV